MTWKLTIGATPGPDGTYFRVWAPNARRVEVVLFENTQPMSYQALQPDGEGYFAATLAGVEPGARYMYRLDGGAPRPDPASRFQPEGVHGPSQVVDPSTYRWSDSGWRGVALDELVIYELHVGTATLEGTFDALIERLDDLRDLGVTALELLPLADFPGERNWGDDGVNLFAPSRAYGGPEALRRLVDAAHMRGLAVLLDVVYNHLGPDGNYLRVFSADYFTARHHTPWGEALNFDGPNSRPVRDYFIANACYWAHEYHIDGLRLDATHAILDDSHPHFLAELAASVRASLPADRHFPLIAENEHNDPALVRGQGTGDRGQATGDRRQDEGFAEATISDTQYSIPDTPGYGLDALWADDFHHQVRVALTGEREGYFADYSGSAADLAATLHGGWFYIGQHSALLGKPRGAPADDLPPQRFVLCIQNHDQVGNRALGDRLHHQIGLPDYRAMSVLLLLSPYTPMLWMGQEWAASTPFQFFTDHNPELGRLVTKGRLTEFASFAAFAHAEVPDPQAEATFQRSKLRWEERAEPPHDGTLRLYRELLHVRRTHPALRGRSRASFAVAAVGDQTLVLRHSGPAPRDTLLLVLNLRGELRLALGEHPETLAPGDASWSLLLDSEDRRYGGERAARLQSASGTPQQLLLDGPAAVVLEVRGTLASETA
jgi:maltooligosyltrehalose trehalohydrolase